jgi:hypothetical protein
MRADASALLAAVIDGDAAAALRVLAAEPALAATAFPLNGATRKNSRDFFFEKISHYLYAGDTPLHMAAAAFDARIARILLDRGASVRAKNRRGAEPLHYAADTNHWNPAAQRKTIECLIAAGADPNAVDKSGTAPLHRAVRTRSSAAVAALIAGGADVNIANGRGSTPFQLTEHNTGRGGSGSARAKTERALIVDLLMQAGATR